MRDQWGFRGGGEGPSPPNPLETPSQPPRNPLYTENRNKTKGSPGNSREQGIKSKKNQQDYPDRFKKTGPSFKVKNKKSFNPYFANAFLYICNTYVNQFEQTNGRNITIIFHLIRMARYIIRNNTSLLQI